MSKNNTKDKSSIVQEVNNKSSEKLKIKTTDDKVKWDIEDKQKQDVILIGIATKQCKFFHDSQGEAFAKISANNHTEIWNLSSMGFRDWISHQLWSQHREGLSNASLDSALATLRGIATFDSPIEEVYLRVAQINNELYIDLCNEDWQVIKVDSIGWSLINKSPVSFIRSKNMRALKIPISKGDINLLKKHINIKEKDFVLIIGWLLMSMQAGKGAYPILVLRGSAGCGKTTTSRMLRELVDPNIATLLSKPKTENLRVIGTNNHVLAFDNLSGIGANQSDALCKISTGDNQTVRKLYTTNEEFTISLKKPILLNGIDEIAKRSDIASRSIKIDLSKLENYSSEHSIWNAFMIDIPSILGGLLYGLSAALNQYENTRINNLPRMGDFSKWATAAGQTYGWMKDEFMLAYTENLEQSYLDSIESSEFASALVTMFDNHPEFKGSPIELLTQLELLAINGNIKNVRTAKGVTEQLSRYDNALNKLGIFIKKYRDRTNKTVLIITKNVSTYNRVVKTNSQSNEEWIEDYDLS
jgi:hypothetical protein|tara:strand:+ start:1258 stop:2844 length:1587 start_codon:yes stop_codon:yes gene_type:complete